MPAGRIGLFLARFSSSTTMIHADAINHLDCKFTLTTVQTIVNETK